MDTRTQVIEVEESIDQHNIESSAHYSNLKELLQAHYRLCRNCCQEFNGEVTYVMDQ